MEKENEPSTLPAVPGDSSGTERTVINPEVVPDHDQGGRHSQQGAQGQSFQQYTTMGGNGGSGSTRFTFTSWQAGGSPLGGGLMVTRDGCLPALVTLVLALSCTVQFGLLSAIGFLVFYALGSGIGFIARVRGLMEGRHISPWFFRIGSWLVAYALVVWLSDGF